jgi:hypothetical protein
MTISGAAATATGQEARMDEDTAISYEAAVPGSRVLTSAGQEIGTLEHVLEVPSLDVFDGIVIHTKAGLRFVDADQVGRITASYIRLEIDNEQAARLPAPDGPPVYHVDALADSGHSMHDLLGRMFRRPHWTQEK